MALNMFIGHGRMTKDIEIREVKNGELKMGRSAIAITRNDKSSDFINFIVYGQRAETMARFFKKGSELIIRGSISTGSYTGKDGKKVYTTDILVDSFDFCGKKSDNSNNNSNSNSNSGGIFGDPNDIPTVAPVPDLDFVNVSSGGMDELPFN